MTRIRAHEWPRFLLGAALLANASLAGLAADDLPAFREVVEILRTNLPGVPIEDLDRSAVEGLVERLRPRVSLVGTNAEVTAPGAPLAVLQPRLFGKFLAAVRLPRIEGPLAAGLADAWKELARTNPVKGLVLDLRFATGTDYAAAVAVADLFLSREQPLLDWGAGMKQSSVKDDAIPVPVTVVVNRQTAGAAEALAAMVRDTGVGLIVGTNTAGEATLAEEWPLRDGRRLRMARAGLRLGSGKEIPLTGVGPDLAVAVPPAEERLYMEDPYRDTRPTLAGAATPAAGGIVATNRPPRRRANEADLVRARREGTSLAPEETTVRPRGPETPEVRDPALARALDLLTALVVVREFRDR